jgi:hypothetical protein
MKDTDLPTLNSAKTLDAAPATPAQVEAMTRGVAKSFTAAARFEDPYRHWILSDIFGQNVVRDLSALPFPAPGVDGVSGARELHNDTRQYFDAENNAEYPVCGLLARAFQSPEMVALFARETGAALDGCYLRIEYAQDKDGFWLQPHTDLGVKKLTMLYYLADAPGQESLGTDIYRDKDSWAKRSAFTPDEALIFVPSDHTWHGFEPRAISGVRKSVIINYVTDEWRAREQLAYPATPVRAANN